jgi:lipid II:glycine glycyltransferase (peptidoglycan interpeptide bridge formation enzyme)
VKKSHHYAVRVCEGTTDDIPVLFDLLSHTAERDDFVMFQEHYYKNFYDILARDGMSHLYMGYVDPSATVKMLEEELAAVLEKRQKLRKEGPLKESAETEARLLREIDLFKEYASQYTGEIPVSGHLVVRYGDKAWAVHAGSLGRLNETFCNNRTYYEKLMAQKDAGCVFLDMYGTEMDERFRTVHEFKMQWGGRLIEFIGEFDLVTKPFWYFIYEKIRPLYRKLRFAVLGLLKRNTA